MTWMSVDYQPKLYTMKSKLNRRKFIASSAKTCAGGCILLASSNAAFASMFSTYFGDEKPSPKELNYCGYKCPDKCEFLVATLNNDKTKKKEAFEAWKIEERYGKKYSEEIAFCYGCKSEGKPLGAVTGNCTVRACTIEKGFDCCIECKELKSCDKDLWSRFPEFHKGVIKLQGTYFS